MLSLEVLEDICFELEWVPVIDCASDPTGSNTLAVAFYDVFVNALLQIDAIKGKDLVMNPSFCCCKQYKQLAEDAFEADKETRILLIVPKRAGEDCFKELEGSSI